MVDCRVEYLNHASLLVHVGRTRLLFDPWLEGSAFSGGWGLRYDNPHALERAATATHLWISHWHSDHLHAPTLAKLAGLNPSMRVLANVSENFSMVERLAAFGFNDVVRFGEREPTRLGDGLVATRYPTAGIDNMLHLATPTGALLNYNDCNLPLRALRRFMAKLGPVDLLFTNYNHAGKLFDRDDDATRKDRLWENLLAAVDAVAPRHIVPFASSHYYRTEASRPQNSSMLSFDDLRARSAEDARFVVLDVGQAARFGSGAPVVEPAAAGVAPNACELHDYGARVPWDELIEGAEARCRAVHARFWRLTRWLPPLHVRVTDYDRVLRLRAGRPPEVAPVGTPPDIATHSRALFDWLARRFGDDTFIAGAHFTIESPDTRAIEAWALVTLLDASHLDPRHLAGYVLGGTGRRFLWNRREEPAATLLGWRFKAGQMRL